MKKRYLITGGSGFIGAALVHRLFDQGHQVRVLDNGFRGNLRRLQEIEGQIEYIEGDIRDKDVVSEACKNIDVVCHLAFVNGTDFFYSQPELVLDVGVKGMMNVLDSSIHHGIKEFVLMSSSEVYQTPPIVPTDESVGFSIPDPLNPRYSYGGGKLISELMLINYSPRHFDKSIIIRPHNVYGPDMGWEHVIPQFALRMRNLLIKETGPLPFPIQGSGQESRAFVFIDDFIDGMLLAMEKGTQQDIYHVGTSDEITIQHLAERIGNYYSREVTLIPGELCKGGTSRRCPSINKLQNIGFQPKSNLDDGLAKTIAWYDANAHLRPVKND
jgi:nucleoside-diphosphate-sugar epimerase